MTSHHETMLEDVTSAVGIVRLDLRHPVMGIIRIDENVDVASLSRNTTASPGMMSLTHLETSRTNLDAGGAKVTSNCCVMYPITPTQ